MTNDSEYWGNPQNSTQPAQFQTAGQAQQQAQAQYAQPQPQPQPQYSQATYAAAPEPVLYMYDEAIFPMSQIDRVLRLIAFILNVISCVSLAVFILPLAWMAPMTIHSYKIYKGQKPNTVGFGICNVLFLNFISGILLLCSHKDTYQVQG